MSNDIVYIHYYTFYSAIQTIANMTTDIVTLITCKESLKLLADFWTLRIIESLATNTLRYCEIQRAVGNVNPTTLTKKLQQLEEAKLIKRFEESEQIAVRYQLTTLGKQALPVVAAIKNFSKKALPK